VKKKQTEDAPEARNIFEGSSALYEILEEIEDLTQKAELQLRRGVRPLKKSLIKRFPVLFLLLVTAGFASVSYGMEHIITEHATLSQHPYYVLWGGVLILIVTGAAYKRK
jgi:hypothetical protein